ncbi:phosphoribosyltransferase family protein [Priestia megaterium]|jgi:competence protein ComFC
MVTNQEFLLIDDIYTTGATVRQAANCLQEAGARSVRSLTLIRA